MNGNDSATLGKLSREVDASRNLMIQSVGWLIREVKVTVEKSPPRNLIALC